MSREEAMLAALVEGNPITDKPTCRREEFLKAIANNAGTANLPEPICREEVLFKRIAEKGLDRPDQTKTVYPSTSRQVVTPDSGWELGSVTVEPMNLQTKTIDPLEEQQEVVADSEYHALSSVIVNAMAVAKSEIDLIMNGRYGGLTDEQATTILDGTYIIDEEVV